MEQHTYRYLESLKDSDFQIVEGEPNIIGWEVKNESDAYLGEVEDLLFDPQTRAVRYIVIDLDDNGMNLDDKKVMVPIGIAHLHTSDDEVMLPNLHIDQFNALPAYIPEQVTPEMEVQIREVIGSPAALRIEETITEFDQDQFYTHQHFDKDKFYQRRPVADSTATPDSVSIRNRAEEEATIHDLIDNSKEHDLHAADPETGIGTHHNEHKDIQDWGTDASEDRRDNTGNTTRSGDGY